MSKRKINTHLQAAWMLHRYGYVVKPIRGELEIKPTKTFKVDKENSRYCNGSLISLNTLMDFAKKLAKANGVLADLKKSTEE